MSSSAHPIVDAGGGLEDYIAAGDATTQELLEGNGAPITALKRYDVFFRDELWMLVRTPTSMASVLFMNAYMLFLSGVRTALTGHTAAVFPVLRTALESACYGLLWCANPPW